MTGDMINCNSDNFENFYSLVTKLSNKYPMFYVFGNHEISLDEEVLNSIVDFLKTNGVVVLGNQKFEIVKNDSHINLFDSLTINQFLHYLHIHFLHNQILYLYFYLMLHTLFFCH